MEYQVMDMMGRMIPVPPHPTRIISLVPSQTALLWYLGASESVVGVTKFCVTPPDAKSHARIIGGTKMIRHSVIDALHPDLIIANKEENTQEDITILAAKYPVWVSDVVTLEDAFYMIQAIGDIVGKTEQARIIIQDIEKHRLAFHTWRPASLSALYLIWEKPRMAAGTKTFINSMMTECGFQNVLSKYERYPVIHDDLLADLDTEIILLSSEPYLYKEKHLKYYQTLFPNKVVLCIDGVPFSWYGSSLLGSFDYFRLIWKRVQTYKKTLTD